MDERAGLLIQRFRVRVPAEMVTWQALFYFFRVSCWVPNYIYPSLEALRPRKETPLLGNPGPPPPPPFLPLHSFSAPPFLAVIVSEGSDACCLSLLSLRGTAFASFASEESHWYMVTQMPGRWFWDDEGPLLLPLKTKRQIVPHAHRDVPSCPLR